ncbi:cation-transporting P-type ATPase [Aurantimonas sp. VKM B-3413]|uniref:cation-transporting P-type ATPase n=1 Tax=Aurantimonas sp. VKM B-3413 TaxID=2779401 RepID=UPI001E57311E|nr:cation-transporting P-type ATPase [Aurantimonas sp. VKM B-3413]MCB8840173.1 hypothetical protein [Aurantimonas sp. VKM B-3413]
MTELGGTSIGLSSKEAADRLKRHAANLGTSRETQSVTKLLLRQVECPLVLILHFGSCISLILREWADAVIILAIIAASTMLGFFQEFRASRVIAQLRQRLALSARVLREGTETEVPVADKVPGDIVLLSAGNLVAADGLIPRSKGLPRLRGEPHRRFFPCREAARRRLA